jgi:hypothetical protein
MLFRNQFLKFYAPAGSDGAASGGAGAGAGEGAGEGAGSGEGAGAGAGEGTGSGENSMSESERKLLREAMAKKEEIAQLRAQLKAFEGVDPKRYQELTAAQVKAEAEAKEREQKALIERGQFEEALKRVREEQDGVLGQVRTQFTTELQTVAGERDTLNQRVSALTQQIEDLTIGEAFSNSPFIRDELVQAMSPARNRRLYGDHFDLVDGKVVGFDKPRGEQGRSPLVDKDGQNVSFDEALKRILSSQPDFETMLRSQAKQGAGSGTANEKAKETTHITPGLGRIAAALNKG